MVISSEYIRQAAIGAGFSLCGLAPSRRLAEHGERFGQWLSSGCDSGLSYLSRWGDVRYDPAAIVAGAKTIVVCALNYKNNALSGSDSMPKISCYAVCPDYHKVIKRKLKEVYRTLRHEYPNVEGRIFCDTAPILEKAWAVEAGLGWYGRNSLVITPQYGSFVFLGILVLDALADRYDKPMERDGCGNCRACIESCPNGAIGESRTIDTGKCISRLTTQKMPDGSEPSVDSLHGWVYGCDACQICCPHNRKSPLAETSQIRPIILPEQFSRKYWEDITPTQFGDDFGKTPLGSAEFTPLRDRILRIYHKYNLPFAEKLF